MAVKIDVPGIGEITAENAASESTLRELLKVMGGKGPNGQGGTGDASEKTGKQVKSMGKAAEVAGEEVESFGDKLGNFVAGGWNMFTAAIGAVVGSVVGLGTELAAGGNRLSDFTQYLPIPGLNQFAGLLDGQVDLFRQLSTTGAAFGNNMFEITRIAGNAAIPQRDFAELLATNAEGMRLFGSSVQDGARNFAGMSKQLRQGGLGPRLMEMGFSTQELNENFLAYNEMMVVSGQRQRMSQSQLIAGAQQYSMELDALTRLTGKSRKELEDAQKQANMDIRRQMAMSRMSADEARRFSQNLTAAGAKSKDLEAALLDMADGVANDPLTRQLESNSETFRREAANIQNMSSEELANFMARVRQEGMTYLNTVGEEGVQAAIARGTELGSLATTIGALGTVVETTGGTVSSEQAARDASTAALTTMAETINTIRGRFQAAFVDNPIFQDMLGKFTSMLPTLDEANEMFDQAAQFFNTHIQPALNDVWQWLTGEGFVLAKQAMGDTWKWIMETAWPNVKSLFTELGNMWTQYGPAIKQFFSDLIADPGAVWNDTIVPLLKQGFSDMIGGIDWVDFGITAAGLIVASLVRLNPFGLVASTIISGIVGFIGWENIAQFFSANEFGQAVSNAVRGIFNWITGLFDFDFGAMISSVIPDWAKRFLPDSWFSGPSTSSSSSAPTAAELEDAEAQASASGTPSVETRTADNATSREDISLVQLNTNTRRMIELLETQNRLLARLDGNLVG